MDSHSLNFREMLWAHKCMSYASVLPQRMDTSITHLFVDPQHFFWSSTNDHLRINKAIFKSIDRGILCINKAIFKSIDRGILTYCAYIKLYANPSERGIHVYTLDNVIPQRPILTPTTSSCFRSLYPGKWCNPLVPRHYGQFGSSEAVGVCFRGGFLEVLSVG
jgi:hypothetical protein